MKKKEENQSCKLHFLYRVFATSSEAPYSVPNTILIWMPRFLLNFS